jgi:hypothetical protein
MRDPCFDAVAMAVLIEAVASAQITGDEYASR